MRRVSYIFPVSHHYRLPFHERLRMLLASQGVDYRVVYCDPGTENLKKMDTVDISWGVKVAATRLSGTSLVYQHALREASKSDLVILQQENSLLFNYLASVASMLGLKKIAYFGHGKNFQSRNPDSRAEKFKRFWATRADWWFGYTEETRRHIESLGFPLDRITVFNNSIDTRELRALAQAVTPERLAERRRELGLVGDHVAIFVGGLYADKRLEFLIASVAHVRTKIPDFELLVVGGGPDLEHLRLLVAPYPWVKVLGPRFGKDKVELMSLAQLFLMPGLVGLAILDAATVGLPTITTAFPWHSPEIAYLENGINGVMVADWENSLAYGDAIVSAFADPGRLNAMSDAARAMSETYTIEAMAERFAEGVMKALA